MTSPSSRRAPHRFATLFAALIAAALVLSSSTVATAAPNPTAVDSSIRPMADLSQFNPGMIISDAAFFNTGTMSEQQVSDFINAKSRGCDPGYTCLTSFRQTTVAKSADSYCSGYTAGTNESAARILWKTAQSCGINPQVLLVMLQKEQALITRTNPSASHYRKAMGQGCPDDAACDARFEGFQNQVYGAARQLQVYAEGKYFTYYAPGKTWNILFNPNRACGTSPVYVSNTATAALYYYTPYQPNGAALRAGYGSGDSCSSYGNRNFYNYFVDWFGATYYKVEGSIGDYWRSEGAGSGWIGEPTSAMRGWGGGWSQRFTGADVYFESGGSRGYATIGGTRDEYRFVGEVASGLSWPTGPVQAAGGGWYQDFRGGRIYVRPGDGAGFAVASPINEVYETQGNISGVLGWPSSRAYRYADGSRQDFAGGSVFQGPAATVALAASVRDAFVSAGGPSVLGWPSRAGQAGGVAFVETPRATLTRNASGAVLTVRGAIQTAYAGSGGVSGALGLPLAEERAEGAGRSQTFVGGTVYSGAAGAYAVTGLRAALAASGGVAVLGYPTSAQSGSGSSLSQNFEKGTLTTGPRGSYVVGGVIGSAYRGMGAAASYLGAAVGPERTVPGGYVQDFDGGRIYCSAQATVAVPAVVGKLHDAGGGTSGRLGWPISTAASTQAGGWKQSFSGGDIFVTTDGSAGGAVVGATLRTYLIAGGPAVVGFPTGPEVESAAGFSQTFQKGLTFVPRAAPASAIVGGVYQAFKDNGGVDVFGFAVGPQAAVDGVSRQPFANATLYVTPSGVYFARGYIRTYYDSWGGATGILGLPAGNEYTTAGGFRQDFTGGSIMLSAGTGAAVVRGALGAEYKRRGGQTGPLGWPLSNEISSVGQWQQRFQGGTLVLFADGHYEVR